MWVLTFKIRWWRVVCFFLSALIIAAGIYFLLSDREAEKKRDVEPNKQEGQVWQV